MRVLPQQVVLIAYDTTAPHKGGRARTGPPASRAVTPLVAGLVMVFALAAAFAFGTEARRTLSPEAFGVAAGVAGALGIAVVAGPARRIGAFEPRALAHRVHAWCGGAHACALRRHAQPLFGRSSGERGAVPHNRRGWCAARARPRTHAAWGARSGDAHRRRGLGSCRRCRHRRQLGAAEFLLALLPLRLRRGVDARGGRDRGAPVVVAGPGANAQVARCRGAQCRCGRARRGHRAGCCSSERARVFRSSRVARTPALRARDGDGGSYGGRSPARCRCGGSRGGVLPAGGGADAPHLHRTGYQGLRPAAHPASPRRCWLGRRTCSSGADRQRLHRCWRAPNPRSRPGVVRWRPSSSQGRQRLQRSSRSRCRR